LAVRATSRTSSIELSSTSGRESAPVSCTTAHGGSRVSALRIAISERAQARPSTSSGVTISVSSRAAARPRLVRSSASSCSGDSMTTQ
jgi:hypothetical protein